MAYNEEDIKVISWSEHIRLRPAMYLGYLNMNGIWTIIYHLLDEIIDVSKEKYNIIITTNKNTVSLLLKFQNTKEEFDYIDNVGLFAGGYYLGIPSTLALSKTCKIDVLYNNKQAIKTSTNGKIDDCLYYETSDSENYVSIDFTIDETIFKTTEINYDFLCQNIQQFAYTASNCSFICKDIPSKQTRKFKYKNGLKDLFDLKMIASFQQNNQSLFLKTTISNYDYEICLDLYGGKPEKQNITFANHFQTTLGGSLEVGIQDGVVRAIKKFIKTHGHPPFYFGNAKDYLITELFIVAKITGVNFVFKGATREALEMPNIKSVMSEYVYIEVLNYLNTSA